MGTVFVPLMVFILVLLLYFEVVTGYLSKHITAKKESRDRKNRLNAMELAYKIADDAIEKGIPKEKLKPKKIANGTTVIDVQEIYDALLEAHLKDI